MAKYHITIHDETGEGILDNFTVESDLHDSERLGIGISKGLESQYLLQCRACYVWKPKSEVRHTIFGSPCCGECANAVADTLDSRRSTADNTTR